MSYINGVHVVSTAFHGAGGVDLQPSATSQNPLANKVVSKTFSNALKGNASGDVVVLNDISPVEHHLSVKLSSKNLLDYTNFEGIDVSSVDPIANGIKIIGRYYVSAPVSLSKGKSYVFSCTVGETTGMADYAGQWRVCYVDDTFSDHASPGTALTLTKDAKSIMVYINFSGTEEGTAEITDIQLEEGTTATAYTEYVGDVTQKSVKVYGEDLSTEIATYTANSDGTVEGVEAIFPTMTLVTDADTLITLEYNKDINKALAEIMGSYITDIDMLIGGGA